MDGLPVDAEKRPPQVHPGLSPVRTRGKSFFCGSEKFFIKGATYGAFAPNSAREPFPEPAVVADDLRGIRDLGANTLRTYDAPPRWLLDLAAAAGLRVLVGIPCAWAQFCFLDSRSVTRRIGDAVERVVWSCRAHPAVLGYVVANEIPTQIVRWHGPRRVEAFLSGLAGLVKAIDPEALVSYANYPPTEYLSLPFLDFLSFNVFLHREPDFRRYVLRLQNLAESRPLVLTEFGMDTIREGPERQAQTLAWQIRDAYALGAAGTFVYSWTDEWFAGGSAVQDWAFGLTDRGRRPKPAYSAVRTEYTQELPPPINDAPRVSVVVCAYNAEPTLRECLESLTRLRYPDYEVIVVDDGSKDATGRIADEFAAGHGFQVIHQQNLGLGFARNVGIAASRGQIIAFTDSDCVADPDWLTYLVHAFLASDVAAVGGPNLPPPEPRWVASAVAVSPGGPSHVLLDDERAEHIPGCNMAFRREVFTDIGVFDPAFHAAGDDVDICWRIQDAGRRIGFSPGALVWHHRRNTVAAYLGQQRGYGKAEAMLYFKHPFHFNVMGQSRWLGRIYSDFTRSILASRPVIYFGPLGRAFFQTLYEPPSSLLAYLPFTLEWTLLAAVLAGAGLLFPPLLALPLAMAALTAASAALSAARAPLDPRHDGLKARLLVAALSALGPLARSLERYRWRIFGLGQVQPTPGEDAEVSIPGLRWLDREFDLAYWNERGLEKESLLDGVKYFLGTRKYPLVADQGWNPWDLEVYRGVWSRARLTVAVEQHGGPKRLLRVRSQLRLTIFARVVLLGYSLAAALLAWLGPAPMAGLVAGLGAVNAAIIVQQVRILGRVLAHTFASAADGSGFVSIDPEQKT